MVRRFVRNGFGALRGALHAEASPVRLWPGRSPRAPIDRLRETAAAALRERAAARGRGWAWFELTLAAALWPLLSALRALRQVIAAGGRVARDHGVPRWRQFAAQVWLAVAKNCAPRWYYQRLLYTPAARAQVDATLLPHEVEQVLRRVHDGLDGATLDDKARFAAHCQEHDLPAPRTYAVFDGGEERWLAVPGPDALTLRDVVVKPTALSGGRGVERWDVEDGAFVSGGRRLDLAALLAHVRARAQDGPVLLQEALANHPDVGPLGPRALCTLRVVTYRFASGESGALDAALRMPSCAHQVVDNTGAGGIMARLDLATGTLDGAASERDLVDVARVHPATGAPIEGRRVSTWREALRLCERAHATVPRFAFVAWDVGLTPDGPRLVEANTVWGVPDVLALGETPFVPCALERLDRAS